MMANTSTINTQHIHAVITTWLALQCAYHNAKLHVRGEQFIETLDLNPAEEQKITSLLNGRNLYQARLSIPLYERALKGGDDSEISISPSELHKELSKLKMECSYDNANNKLSISIDSDYLNGCRYDAIQEEYCYNRVGVMAIIEAFSCYPNAIQTEIKDGKASIEVTAGSPNWDPTLLPPALSTFLQQHGINYSAEQLRDGALLKSIADASRTNGILA